MPAAIPRGIEVLVKKASVDPAFRALLLERRAKAAKDIYLTLGPTEAAMLNTIPAAQLEAIVARTQVEPESQAVFIGNDAAAMLATLGDGREQERPPAVTGSRPRLRFALGIRPGGP
jgi:hypothetical protein